MRIYQSQVSIFKHIVFLLLLTSLTFANALFNGFVGDDEVIFNNNRFYTSLSHVTYLFTDKYFARPHRQDISKANESSQEEIFFSGSVAYRPVLSATFFWDYFWWKKKAFGFHLTNVMLHLFNVILVYLILRRLLNMSQLALFAASVFAIHPTKVEAVCAIGYRADVLAGCFVLLAFYFFIKRNLLANKVRHSLGFGLIYFLALFSKESAIVLPLIILGYCLLYKQLNIIEIWRKHGCHFVAMLFVTLFYLTVYLVVFPNDTVQDLTFHGGQVLYHVTTSIWIFVQYLYAFINPLAVNILPPLYAPAIEPNIYFRLLTGIFLILAYVFFMWRMARHDRCLVFLMLWGIVAVLPVLNIIPIDNPMAYRFLYLPSVGFLGALAIVIDQCARWLFRKHPDSRGDLIIKGGYLFLCLLTCVSLNFYWKNTKVNTLKFIKDYPNHDKGYLVLAGMHFANEEYHMASQFYQKAIDLGTKDYRAYHKQGLLLLHDEKKADDFFKRHAQYGSPYTLIGRDFLLRGQYERALDPIKKSVALSQRYAAYGYLIQIYQQLDQTEQAQIVLTQAIDALSDPKHIESLKQLLKPAAKSSVIDLGF